MEKTHDQIQEKKRVAMEKTKAAFRDEMQALLKKPPTLTRAPALRLTGCRTKPQTRQLLRPASSRRQREPASNRHLPCMPLPQDWLQASSQLTAPLPRFKHWVFVLPNMTKNRRASGHTSGGRGVRPRALDDWCVFTPLSVDPELPGPTTSPPLNPVNPPGRSLPVAILT